MFKKNTAITGFPFGLVSKTDGSDITTGTPVGYFTLDGGAQTAIADVSPVHEGNGQWSFDLLAAEMNGDIVGLVFTHGSAITVHFTIKTDTKIVSELNDFDPATDDVALVTLVTNLTNLPSIPAGWLTNAGIAAAAFSAAKFAAGAIDAVAVAANAFEADAFAAGALDGKGNWNIGKGGYSLTQAFPTNFADMSIVVTTGLVNITQAAADKIWASASRELTALGFSYVGADFGATSLNGKGDWNTVVPLNAAQTETEVDNALVALHLDHLLAVNYDPAAKPGNATALLNELIENDGGVSRFTANSLEQTFAVILSELTSIPAATPTVGQALMLPFMAIRNKRDTTATADEIHNSAGTVIATAAVSDDTVVFTKGKYA